MRLKKKYPMNREQWILQMYNFGKPGVEDFGHTHKKIIPASKKLIKKTNLGPSLKKLDPNLDVKGFDLPRDDIKEIKAKGNKKIRIGNDTVDDDIKYFKRYILPQINKAFTEKELKEMELYIEYPSKRLNRSKKFAGESAAWLSSKNKKISIIDLAHRKDAPTAVHEIIHALRFTKGTTLIKNVHADEAETELEVMARLSPQERAKITCNDGYYKFLKGNKCKARKEDVKIIDDNCNLKNKAGLTACIRKNLKKTNIGKVKIPKKYHLKK